MEQIINEKWLQFAFINSRGTIHKIPLKFPFHAQMEIDEEFPLVICRRYTFLVNKN